jgi:hypothetical protein
MSKIHKLVNLDTDNVVPIDMFIRHTEKKLSDAVWDGMLEEAESLRNRAEMLYTLRELGVDTYVKF